MKARELLGWVPKFDSLEAIIETAWKWEQGRPKNCAEPMLRRLGSTGSAAVTLEFLDPGDPRCHEQRRQR
jgi:hypothetical protein